MYKLLEIVIQFRSVLSINQKCAILSIEHFDKHWASLQLSIKCWAASATILILWECVMTCGFLDTAVYCPGPGACVQVLPRCEVSAWWQDEYWLSRIQIWNKFPYSDTSPATPQPRATLPAELIKCCPRGKADGLWWFIGIFYKGRGNHPQSIYFPFIAILIH